VLAKKDDKKKEDDEEEEETARPKVDSVYLHVQVGNDDARKFWETWGFQVKVRPLLLSTMLRGRLGERPC